MNLINLVVILFILAGMATAQLGVDKDKFEFELHPNEVLEKSLTLENIGDSTIFKISASPISGNASEFIELELPEIEYLDPGDEDYVDITFAIPPDAESGLYTGVVYIFDDAPLSFPTRIEFSISIIKQESWGVSLTINDAKSDSMIVDADEIAEFEIVVRNTGLYKDVVSIDIPTIPDDWVVELYDEDELVYLPYTLPLSSGSSKELYLDILGTLPSKSAEFEVTAKSIGNPSKNSTVKASVETNMALRMYNIISNFPSEMVVNRTYSGDLEIVLGVKELIKVEVVSPPGLLVIPESQVVQVTPDVDGFAEFTLMATEPGTYTIIFKLVDKNGVPMPDETVDITVFEPSGIAIIAGDDLLGKVALCYAEVSEEVIPVTITTTGELYEEDVEVLLTRSEVIILGNESVVSHDVDDMLGGVTIKRIFGDDITETTWLFASAMWINGTEEVVVSGPTEALVIKAYRVAKEHSVPLIISSGDLSERTILTIEDLTKREIALSKVLLCGEVDEDARKAMEELGLSIEEV